MGSITNDKQPSWSRQLSDRRNFGLWHVPVALDRGKANEWCMAPHPSSSHVSRLPVLPGKRRQRLSVLRPRHFPGRGEDATRDVRRVEGATAGAEASNQPDEEALSLPVVVVG